MSESFFIFGLGYTAKAFADQLIEKGYDVVGTVREPDKKTAPTSPHLKVIAFESLEIEKHLRRATHLLISIPPANQHGDLVLWQYGHLIKRYASHIQWIGYLSSTGVYGDHQGRWVDEESPCKPTSASGILRLQAETAWLSFAKQNALPLHIFRLAGIYGPRRCALQRLQAGKSFSVFKEGQVFSRIHFKDIVKVLFASLQAVNPLSIYNVADDEPESSHVVDAYAASLLNRRALPLIPWQAVTLSSRERDFYSSNRRVSNQKIKRELQIQLEFPSFREGLNWIKNLNAGKAESN